MIFDVSEQNKDQLISDIRAVRMNITAIGERIISLENLLKSEPKEGGYLGALGELANPPKDRLEAMERQVARANDRIDGFKDASVDLIKEANKTIDYNNSRSDAHFLMVSNAIRARDAIAMLETADTVVMEEGPKLIRADDLSDDKEWGAAYARWFASMQSIDKLIAQWSERSLSMLDISAQELEGSTFVAPAHIVQTDDSNRIRYKKINIAHITYVNRRDNISAFFDTKASQLPF